jgi:putative transposase
VNVFPFVEAEQAEQRNVSRTCGLLEVSRSAFYVWHQHPPPTARELSDAELGDRIEAIHAESKGPVWGAAHSRRAALHPIGCGRKRVARIMRQRGLAGRCRRKWVHSAASRRLSAPAHASSESIQRSRRRPS